MLSKTKRCAIPSTFRTLTNTVLRSNSQQKTKPNSRSRSTNMALRRKPNLSFWLLASSVHRICLRSYRDIKRRKHSWNGSITFPSER
jgi:hypothetical protein